MLPEALVLFACLNSTGCSETSTHYYNTHPEVREMIQKNEQKIERFIGPTLIQTLGPVLYIAAGKSGTMRINKYLSLQLSSQTSTLVFNKEL